MEQDDRDLAGAARSAHVLHITPRIGGESERLVQSTLGKLSNRTETGVALLAIVPERETAYELASYSRAESTASSSDAFVPLTTPSRAARLLQQSPAAVVGTPVDLLALVRATELKLQGVRQVVILWPESMLTDETLSADLDTLLSELPRDADRTLIAEHATPVLESFIERIALKPRRLTHAVAIDIPPRQLGYVIVAAEQRVAALQRLLDARDTSDVAVVADDEHAAREAGDAIAALGENAAAVLNPGDAPAASLVVWYGPPRGAQRVAALLSATSEASEIVLLATAVELQRMRALSPALALSPASFPQPTDAAAQRVRALRDELTSLLRREPMDAELATIEPLLATHDAAEIAAAALRLLGRARQALARVEQVDRSASVAAVPRAAPAPVTPEQTWTRLFLNVGERDGVRRGDLVGAITGEASIPGSQIGKITLHETYSLVEVASPVAEHVVERLTGVSIRGRRVSARPDRAGARGAPAEARRGGRRELSDGPQGARGGPRAAREHEEWSTRGERLRHARRPAAEPPGGEP